MPALCCDRPTVSKGDLEKDLVLIVSREETLRALVEPWLAAELLELDDIEVTGSGNTPTVRVLVDAEGGVDLDRLTEISNGISRLLDDDDPIEGRYRLEVSSPGLERNLRSPRHFQKSVGREVKAKVRVGESNETVVGVISDADDESFVIKTDNGAETAYDYDVVFSAKTMFRWEKSPKPGKKK